jgi:hypothetical protein
MVTIALRHENGRLSDIMQAPPPAWCPDGAEWITIDPADVPTARADRPLIYRIDEAGNITVEVLE